MTLSLPELPLSEPDWLFAVLMGLVLLIPLIAERIRVPAIVGLVLAGALVGPGGLGLIARDGAVAVLGTVGLLYLMLLAGLELDIEEFTRHRRDSILLGALSFGIPMALGLGSSLLLGFGAAAAVLIASCWASHTLLTYGVFRRHGIVATRAVSTAVGGTILTDTAALLTLAIVARAHHGELSAAFWLLLALSIAALAGVTAAALPRLGRWFFTRFAHEQGVRFVFVLAALFSVSALAHLVGLEPIIGAFLAGLALNRLVPNGSQLMQRVEFVGSNLLVPLFLLSVGLLIDFRLLTDPRTVLLAVAFTAVAIIAKAFAAAVAGAVLDYTRWEIAAVFSLTGAQAAATLAAVVVGLRIGLLSAEVVNAAVMVILVSCLLTAWAASLSAPRLAPPLSSGVLGRGVVLPVVRPTAARALARLAAAFASIDGGVVHPVTIAAGPRGADQLARLRRINVEVERMARAHGVEAEGIVRIDSTPALGVLNTMAEREASMLLMGWHGPDHRAMFALDSPINPLVAEAPAPMLLAHLDDRPARRVLVIIADADTTPGGIANLRLALTAAERLSGIHRCPIVVIVGANDQAAINVVADELEVVPQVVEQSGAAVLRENARPDDIVVIPVPRSDVRLRAAERLRRAARDSQIVAAIGEAPPRRKSGRARDGRVPGSYEPSGRRRSGSGS